jgi:hypothetical protein
MAPVSSAIICFFFIMEMKSLLGYKNQQAQCFHIEEFAPGRRDIAKRSYYILDANTFICSLR